MNCESLHTFAVLAYSSSPFIKECIDSLVQQTCKSKIIICTSTPSSFIDSLSMHYKIPVVVNGSKEKTIASDWSFAYNSCDTPHLTMAHQDDIYLPEYAENCINLAEKIKNSLILFTDYAEISGETIIHNKLNLHIKRLILSVFFLARNCLDLKFTRRLLLSFGSPICCPSVMYNKKNIGSFTFSPSFSVNMDWDAWLRLTSLPGSFIYIPKKLILHRIHASSATSEGISNNTRSIEDTVLFGRLWPKPLADLLAKIYRCGYRGNKI